MLLSDNETKVDMLNNMAIAKTIASIIRDCDERPISIGVHGDWGAGKSSILEMVESEFSANDDGIVCIKFNGWRHQGFEDAKTALMSSIISELEKNQKIADKAKETLSKLWKNINWLSVAKAAGGAIFSLATGFTPAGLLIASIDSVKSAVADKGSAEATIETAGQFLKDAKVFENNNSVSSVFSEFQMNFDELLKKSEIKKLVVLIDDLDRCLPKVTIETLEAVRLFMTNSLALPTLIALCSIALGKPTVSSLAVLGEISISGTMMKVSELANALQVCLDSGAKKVLLPISSAVDLGTVPAELIGCFNLIFYQSAEDAVFKALGVE